MRSAIFMFLSCILEQPAMSTDIIVVPLCQSAMSTDIIVVSLCQYVM